MSVNTMQFQITDFKCTTANASKSFIYNASDAMRQIIHLQYVACNAVKL